MKPVIRKILNTAALAAWGLWPLLASAAEPETTGMITIEIVEDPSFFERFSDWIYLGVIVAALGYYFWRRYRQGRSEQ